MICIDNHNFWGYDAAQQDNAFVKLRRIAKIIEENLLSITTYKVQERKS